WLLGERACRRREAPRVGDLGPVGDPWEGTAVVVDRVVLGHQGFAPIVKVSVPVGGLGFRTSGFTCSRRIGASCWRISARVRYEGKTNALVAGIDSTVAPRESTTVTAAVVPAGEVPQVIVTV